PTFRFRRAMLAPRLVAYTPCARRGVIVADPAGPGQSEQSPPIFLDRLSTLIIICTVATKSNGTLSAEAAMSETRNGTGGGPAFLADLDCECVRITRADPGLRTFDLAPRMRPSLRRLEKLGRIKYHRGRWYPA